jgi:hypothetical protein
MAQADQVIQNDNFPTVRADINNNLAALFTNSSGGTAPTVTVAYQDWIDTSGTDPVWKKRNAANNAWITLGTISGNAIAFEGTLPSQSGQSGKYLSTNGTVASWESVLSLGSIITAGTAVASTSGTSIDFTGIPSWVKRITVMLHEVSTNGTSPPQIQIGDSGGTETTGYKCSNSAAGAGVVLAVSFTTGFGIGINTSNWSASRVISGSITLTLLNSTSNTWSASGSFGASDLAAIYSTAGSKSLSATLDRIRITTVNGTNTFDAGSINILYEG